MGNRHAWAYVQEWGAVNGAHVHILLHQPDELSDHWAITRPALRWAKATLPGAYVTGVMECPRVPYSARMDSLGDAYEAALMGKVHYMLKCAPEELEHELVMSQWRTPWAKQWGQSAAIFGKRLAVWQDRK